MIPKLLTIKGLYSYQTEQTINFAELTKDNLFGIFGNVGAGKSSILEAIMLALYGEVERMGKAGRGYNIMNLRSSDLLVVFDFEIEGKLYRSKVTGNRSKRNFSDAKVGSPSFYEQIDGVYQPLEVKNAETLIGLKSSDFKKTIIIPQGTFQDFLQLGDTDRARMMRELFGLERFELEGNVKFLQNQNDTSAQILRGQLAQIGDVKLEDIEAQQAQLIDFQNIVQTLQVDIEQKRKVENILKQLKTDFEQWQLAQKRHEQLTALDPQFAAFEKQLDNYETAVLVFKNLIINLKKTETESAEIGLEIDKKSAEHTQNKTSLEQLTKSRTALTPQYEQRENLKKQAAEVRKILNIQLVNTEIGVLEARLLKGNTFLKEKTEGLERLKAEAENIEKQRIALRAHQPNLGIINAVKDWFTRSFTIQNEQTRLEEERKKLEVKLEGIQQAKTVILWKDLPLFNIRLANETRISDILAVVKMKIAEVKADIDRISNEQIHLKASEKLESYAKALSEGEPCPLCGATHHPMVMQITEIRSTLKSLDARLIQNRKEVRTLENIENQLITLNINHNNDTEARQVLNLRLVEEKQKLETHYQKFAWSPTFSTTNFAAVEQALKAASEFDNKMKTLEDALRSSQKNKETTERTVEQYRKGINDILRDTAVKQTEIGVLKTQIEILDMTTWGTKSEAVLKQQIQNLEQEYVTIETKFQSLERHIQTLQSNEATLMGTIATLRNTNKRLQEEQTALKLDFQNKLAESSFANEVAIIQVLNSNLNIAKERQKLTDFKNQKLIVAARLTDLTDRLQGAAYDAAVHNALIVDIQTIEKDIQAQNQRIGELKNDIFDKIKRLEARQKIEKTLLDCDYRAKNLSVLRGLFQRSGFVNYASSVYLQSIIKAANERFVKLTKQQLQLEITENNGFIVRDMLNGGQFRDVRTLSGGQTFQAALCLALALSDHIQSRNTARQNFFFLDEGFGSLDRESLHIVFETLKALRKENRIVGIISHVEDMRLEIERYLEVTLSENAGSQVKLVIG
jgi:DNA repair protein SbcC/Rad50